MYPFTPHTTTPPETLFRAVPYVYNAGMYSDYRLFTLAFFL
jgi:hypothetical protein